MTIWQQANPVVPKISSNKAAKYNNNKIDNMVTKPTTVNAHARELGDQLSTVTEKTRRNEMGVAESLVACKTSREGQAAQCLGSTSVVWKSKTAEVLAALRRQDEERRLEMEQFEIECMKKREKWNAEWRKMFDSLQGQGSDGEKPRFTSATVSPSEARVNGIVVSSAAVVQAHLECGGEAASISVRRIHCEELVNGGERARLGIDGSMQEKTVLLVPGQKEVATSSGCPAGAVCSAVAVGVGLLGDCSADWSRSEISGTDVSKSNGMTTMNCMLKESLCETRDGDVSQIYKINQDDVVCVGEETCVGVPEGCQDAFEMEEESRANTEECCCCEGLYKLNEVLMRERCGVISGDACELAGLEEGAMEEWIFSSDDEDEADDVGGGALDGLQTKYLDSRVVSPAGVDGGSVLAEKNDRDRVVEGSIVFDPGENSTWTSGTGVDSDHLELDDVDDTVLAVGDAYGEELACSMEQDQTSVGGLLGEIMGVESVDSPWASTVGEMAFVSQVLTCSGTSGIEGNLCPKSGIEEGSLTDASALGQHFFPMEETCLLYTSPSPRD